MSPARVEFEAALADILHPVKSGRNGDRITLDTPLSEHLEVVKLGLLVDVRFRVIIEPIVEEPIGGQAKLEQRERWR